MALKGATAMIRFSQLTVAAGLCAGMAVGAASAESNRFVGHWHWNAAQSMIPPDEPTPREVTADITSADGARIAWTASLTDHMGQKRVETFEGLPDGSFGPVQGAGDGTTAAFTLANGVLQSTFRHPSGGSDTQSCTPSTDDRRLTCRGTWSDGKGHTTAYIDVYDRL
jgi:hypothetical protein